MAESKPAASAAPKKSKSANEPHHGDFVAEGEDAQEKGYWGSRKTPFDDAEFSLTTGPDAPLTDMRGNLVEVDEHIEKAPPKE